MDRNSKSSVRLIPLGSSNSKVTLSPGWRMSEGKLKLMLGPVESRVADATPPTVRPVMAPNPSQSSPQA